MMVGVCVSVVVLVGRGVGVLLGKGVLVAVGDSVAVLLGAGRVGVAVGCGAAQAVSNKLRIRINQNFFISPLLGNALVNSLYRKRLGWGIGSIQLLSFRAERGIAVGIIIFWNSSVRDKLLLNFFPINLTFHVVSK